MADGTQHTIRALALVVAGIAQPTAVENETPPTRTVADENNAEGRRIAAENHYAQMPPNYTPPTSFGPPSATGGNTLPGYHLAGLGHRYGLGAPLGTGTPVAVIERYEREYLARAATTTAPLPPSAPTYDQWSVQKALTDGALTPDGIERAIIGAREVCELNFGTLIPLSEDLAVTFGVLHKMGYGMGTHIGERGYPKPADFDIRESPVQPDDEGEISQLESDLYSLWVRFGDMTDVEEAIPDDEIAAFIKTLDPALTPQARLHKSVAWLLDLFCTAPVAHS